MKKLIAIYALASSSMVSLAQSFEKPRGEASVVFESAGGKWQKAVITDQSTGESSAAYSLDAEPSVTDTATERHPRIAFYCQKSGEFDRFRIRTDTAIANQATSVSAYSLGWGQLSTRSDDQQIKTRTAKGSPVTATPAQLHFTRRDSCRVHKILSSGGKTAYI
jgi:hypothetical protein